MKERKELKGDALVNKVALMIIELINAALIFGFISDYLTGTSTLAYFVIFEISAIATSIIVPLAYNKWPEKMKYIAFACFIVVYFIGCIGAHVDVAFVMAFPIVLVFILYYDYKLIQIVTYSFNLVIAIDIIYIVFFLKKLHSGVEINSSVLLMEFLGTTVFLMAVRTVTKISNQNNSDKLNTIQSVADRINASIKGINVDIHELNSSSKAVKGAMDEISLGIGNVVDAIQNQMLQTEAIQNRLENVENAAGSISTNISSTLESVKSGNKEVDELLAKADSSVEISKKVTTDLKELKKRVEDMSSITKMIENIAFQTNIMALNANVEAARAGDAGKGFAVVATEISNMAAKTKEATDNIEDLIGNANHSLQILIDSVAELDEVITAEKEQTNQTTTTFNNIQSSTEEVRVHIDTFMEYIDGLSRANAEIVQSVQTISAATEEVNALTLEAADMESGNAYSVQNIANQIGELANN